MNEAIQEFVGCRSIAVVGTSRGGKKFGNAAAKELQNRGYQVFIIHPEAQEIDGQTCYPNLTRCKAISTPCLSACRPRKPPP